MGHDKKEMISFFLTTRCNLDCIYCYTNKNAGVHAFQTLDFDFAKAGIDDYYQTGFAHHVRFFGAGEPTLELDLMRKISEYALEKDRNTTFEIQTNGCFPEETAAWLAEQMDIIWISSDGVPAVQDYYRPLFGGGRSSDVLERNIRDLIKNAKGTVGIRTTITGRNVMHQIEFIKYFSGFGIKNFWADPIFSGIGETETSEEIDMDAFTGEFLRAARYAYQNGMTYGSILTCNFDEPGEYACRACLPVPHLTTDGYVSACDMALFGNDANHMDVFIYGRWDETNRRIEYDEDKIRYLQSRKLSNLSKCSNCAEGEYCRGYCLGEVMNETKNLFGCKSQICNSIRLLFRELTEQEKKYKYLHP